MRVVGEVNKYLTATEPYKMKGDDQRERLGTVLHVAAQCVLDCNTLLAPFLPHSSNKVWHVLGGEGEFMPMPRTEYVEELDPDEGAGLLTYPIITGDYSEHPALGVACRCRSGRRSTSRRRCSPSSTRRWSRRSAPGWPRREDPVRVLVVGASGRLGRAVVAALADRHEVVEASRSARRTSSTCATPPRSPGLYSSVGTVDAVACTAGKTPYGALTELTSDQWLAGVRDKLLGQVELVRLGIDHVSDGGSFTLVSGILSVEPVRTSGVASTVDGAIDAFVRSAAIELPRGLRVNAVSATVFEEAWDAYGPMFPGATPIPVADAARAYVKSIEGAATGQVIRVGY